MVNKNQFDLKLKLLREKLENIQKEINQAEYQKEKAALETLEANKANQLLMSTDRVDELVLNRYKENFFLTVLAEMPSEISYPNTNLYIELANLKLTKRQATKLYIDLQKELLAQENEAAADSNPMSLLNMMSMFQPLLKNPKVQ